MSDEMHERPSVGRRPVPFDVREWLASLSGCPRGAITYRDEAEEGNLLIVSYDCGGSPLANVHVSRVTMLASPNWELVAVMDKRIERIVVPGETRFAWR